MKRITPPSIHPIERAQEAPRSGTPEAQRNHRVSSDSSPASVRQAPPSSHLPPRLLYLADLEVYPSYAGAIQMYRLLELYPADRLMLIYPGADKRQGLPAARHVCPPSVWWARFISRRGGRHLLLAMNSLSWLRWLIQRRPPRWLRREIEAFQPEAVVTVALAGSWILADQLARHQRIPLHVIVHDDLHYRAVYPFFSHGWIDRLFRAALSRAASVTVASEPMRESFLQRFGINSEVIYPTRGRDMQELPPPAIRQPRPWRLVYAGSLWDNSSWEVLDQLAVELRRHGGELIIYSNQAVPAGLNPSFTLRPAVTADVLATRLQEEADVLLQFASFHPSAAVQTASLFPSKLVDYSTTGLPVFMFGPDYSSTTWLARRYPEAFTIVASQHPAVVARAFLALVDDSSRLRHTAQCFAELGRHLFSQTSNHARFLRSLERQAGDAQAVCDTSFVPHD